MLQVCETPEETFALGQRLGESLTGGEIILLHGGLGAGKTLFTKGILSSLHFDVDEVTSPSFTLVNLYKTPRFDVYHVDLWRMDGAVDAASAVGLDELVGHAGTIIIVEWAERLRQLAEVDRVISISIDGIGDEARTVKIGKS